ncbi:hypothetical protein Poly59_36650 [Rubripirellula reticaptiva]|uniref:Uncharacterized protein n=1 Tax=Rubripirellula reticaptiva TaxID=2528013 RepID=A0A5C6EIZ9_9BACT|nr:hypothetical protein Poly59_36650 [Rubripirellula reticaptiva]
MIPASYLDAANCVARGRANYLAGYPSDAACHIPIVHLTSFTLQKRMDESVNDLQAIKEIECKLGLKPATEYATQEAFHVWCFMVWDFSSQDQAAYLGNWHRRRTPLRPT